MNENEEQQTQHQNQVAENLAVGNAVTSQAQQNAQNQYYMQEQETSMTEAQLDCKTTLLNLYHQLRQDAFQVGEEGGSEWCEIRDKKKRRLTDDGLNRIRELMSFYVNKENLLSNFNEDQINSIMLRFRLAFSANILMRYKLYFRQPSFEECKVIFKDRIGEKIKLKMFAGELAGIELEEEKVKKELLSEYEDKLEYEIRKIKEEKTKEMLSEFELLFEQLSQLVYATLNRAWKGEERGSIRRHTNISEVVGIKPPQQTNQGGLFKWGRK
ncbi:MAG: hypothetical protein KAQ92_09075 [Candidatus Aenigmarchaeota archaeon]|nr:hypothetical protein [Candidatus Aenigmarchaeota archaeon]